MKFTTHFLLAAVGLLSACNMLPGQADSSGEAGKDRARSKLLAQEAPSWVLSPGSHPQYPIATFMSDVGHAQVDGDLGAAREEAIRNGMTQISSQLNADIKAETEVYMRELRVNEEQTSTSEYVQQVQSNTESLLLGAQQGDIYHDKAANSLCVLVVLDREQHARALLKKVRSELAKASGEADQATASGKLQALIKEHVIIDKVMPSMITLAVALPGNHGLRAEFDTEYESVKGRMRKIITELNDQSVSVRPVSGQGQKGYAKGSLEQPLVFEATAGGQPLVGFPVSFTLEHPQSAELVAASVTTDSAGRFSCEVVGLTLTGDQENQVRAGLDYLSLKERSLSPPSTEVYYVLPTLESASFAIAIQETNLDRVQPESSVKGTLAAALTERQVNLTSLDAFLSAADVSKAATADVAWLQAELGGKVDYLIRGTARSIASSKAQGSIYFSYAGGMVELIDIRTGIRTAHHEMPLSNAGVKMAGSTFENAGTKALGEFGAQVAEILITKVDDAFKPE